MQAISILCVYWIAATSTAFVNLTYDAHIRASRLIFVFVIASLIAPDHPLELRILERDLSMS